ncbi:MAG: glycosyltransferase [Calditrichaeota bacterium]|nr:glycosyltransferase [Calditrichota bacterium]RQW04014.1 MAG: glycosyltransferase [Calditrichota bacterium]
MLISIITPTFNSEKTVGRCVKSVISQNYLDYEHIIVDKQSNDQTLAIISDLYEQAGLTEKLRLRSESDNGIADAFNRGIQLTSGDVIGILNSDDHLFNSESLSRISEPFIDPSVLYVHGNIYLHDPLYGSSLRRPLCCHITHAMPFNHPALYFRKEIYKINGLYDTRYRLVMDYEFLMRLFKNHRSVYNSDHYIPGDPLVVMYSGGVSWKREKESLKEIKSALRHHGLFNLQARLHIFLRYLRVKIRGFMVKLHLTSLVRLWRKWKWKN